MSVKDLPNKRTNPDPNRELPNRTDEEAERSMKRPARKPVMSFVISVSRRIKLWWTSTNSPWDAWSVRECIQRAGFWDCLVEDGYAMPYLDNDPRMNSEARRDRLLANLYNQGIKGDRAAIKDWIELSKPEQVERSFDLFVNMTPYTIKDKSLAQIAFEADEVPVTEMLRSLIRRCHADNAPDDLTARLNTAIEEWIAWASVAYRDMAAVIQKRLDTPTVEPEEELTPDFVDQELDRMVGVETVVRSV